MTIFFRRLAEVDVTAESFVRTNDEQLTAMLADAYYAPEQMTVDHRTKMAAWLRRYSVHTRHEGVPQHQRRERMHAVNPKYVLRNYLAQLAIDKAEQGDASAVRELLDVLRTPYTEQPGKDDFAAKRPEWARHRPGCSMLSCSS